MARTVHNAFSRRGAARLIWAAPDFLKVIATWIDRFNRRNELPSRIQPGVPCTQIGTGFHQPFIPEGWKGDPNRIGLYRKEDAWN